MKAVTFAIGAFLLLASPASAQFENVGVIDFPTSATGKAQKSFLRGVAILHSFGWKQAISEFQAAQELDPDFVLAYWGETLCYNHPLQNERDADSPRRVLERLGPTREERLAKAPTERERGLLGAVENLWGEVAGVRAPPSLRHVVMSIAKLKKDINVARIEDLL